MSEAELIQRVLSGDKDAAWSLLEPYQQPLGAYLLRLLGSHEDAEEALQETYLRALVGLSELADPRRFRAWLFRIAHNRAVSLLRRQSRPRMVSLAKEQALDDSRPPSGRLAAREERARLTRAIDALPPAEREVVWLRLNSQLTFQEIAEITQAPLGTVLSRMHQAKARLRETLD